MSLDSGATFERPHLFLSKGAASAGRLLVLLATAVAAFAAGVFLTSIPYGRAIWDFLFVLDGSYRISLGQVPHADFASPVGSLVLYMTWAAERLFPSGNPFVGLHVVAWLLVLPPFAMLSSRFQSSFQFFSGLMLLAIIVLVPYTLDSTHLSEISYFATYNRFATAFLFLVGLWLVLPKGQDDGRFDGWLTAYILSILIFLKITAAVVVLALVIAAYILNRMRLGTLLTAVVATAMVTLIVEVSSGMVSAYVHDILDMASVNRGRMSYALFFTGFKNWSPLLALAGVAAASLHSVSLNKAKWRAAPLEAAASVIRDQAFLVIACLVVGAALIAESQNTGGLGLIAASAVVFHSQAWKGSRERALCVGLLAATLIVPVLDVAVKRAVTAVVRERQAAAANPVELLLPNTRIPQSTLAGAALFQRLTTEWLPLARQVQSAGFFLDPDPTTNAPAARLAWAISVVEAAKAFDLLGYRSEKLRFATLSFADPFSRMLHLQPAHGTTIATEIGRTQPLLDVEQAAQYLSDADGVFVSRCEIGGGASNDAVFDAVLDRDFEKKPLHPCWDFYQRISARR